MTFALVVCVVAVWCSPLKESKVDCSIIKDLGKQCQDSSSSESISEEHKSKMENKKKNDSSSSSSSSEESKENKHHHHENMKNEDKNEKKIFKDQKNLEKDSEEDHKSHKHYFWSEALKSIWCFLFLIYILDFPSCLLSQCAFYYSFIQ